MESLLACPSDVSIDKRLVDLIETAAQALQRGDSIDLELLARDYPSHAGALRELLPTIATLIGLGGKAVESAASREGVIGNYQLMAKLGAGGMGSVYMALHVDLQKIVAIKMMSRDRVADASSIARFQREMKAVGRFEHPNVVRATDAGQANGVHFLVMEFVDGLDVTNLMAKCSPLPIPEACELIRQAASGLAFIHQHGLVHRDLKPSNLMVNKQGVTKILDLGLATVSERFPGDPELTGAGQVIGTVDYMAPEQGENGSSVDPRADVYSLGATLYHLLAGRAPLSDARCDTPLKKLAAMVHGTPPPLQLLRPEVPDGLATAVMKMIAKDPTERFASATEVVAVLASYSTGSDLTALVERAPHGAYSAIPAPPTPVSAAAAPRDSFPSLTGRTNVPPTDAGASAPSSTLWRPAAWRTRGWAALIVILLSLVGVGAFGLSSFSVQTEGGTLEFEINDPRVKTLITTEGVVVEDLRTGRSYKLNVTKSTLPAASYEIDVKELPVGVSCETTSFTIADAETTRVRVTLVANQGTEAASAAMPTPNEQPLAVFLGCGEIGAPGAIEQMSADGTSRGSIDLFHAPSGLAYCDTYLAASIATPFVGKGQTIMVGCDGAMEQLTLKQHFGAPIDVAYDAASRGVLVADNGLHTVSRVFPGANGDVELLFEAPLNADHDHFPSMSVAADAAGHVLFSASDPQGVYRLPLAPNQTLPTPLLPDDASVAADPTSNRWVVMLRNELRIFRGNEPEMTIPCPAGSTFWHYRIMSFAPNGSLYVVLETGRGFEIQSLDLTTKRFSPRFVWTGAKINCMAVGPAMEWK